jgi:hypothetical protein
MTHVLLDDGRELLAPVPRDRFEQAIGSGLGRVGLQCARSLRWQWVPIARIAAVDGVARG